MHSARQKVANDTHKVPKVVLNWSFLLEATCNPTELPTSVTMKWSNSNALEKSDSSDFEVRKGSYDWSSLVRFQSQHHFRLIFPFLFLNSDTRLSVFHRNWVSIRNACYTHIQNWTYSFHSCIRRLAWYVEIKTKKCYTCICILGWGDVWTEAAHCIFQFFITAALYDSTHFSIKESLKWKSVQKSLRPGPDYLIYRFQFKIENVLFIRMNHDSRHPRSLSFSCVLHSLVVIIRILS